jgi:predicted nucleotide-binding protein (sugar kinase/HSP70/actin superfamily)
MLMQVNANDILFRTTDVIMICGGFISLVGAYFYMKGSVEKIRASFDVLEEGQKKLIKDMEREHTLINSRIDDTIKNHNDLRESLHSSLQKNFQEVNNLRVDIQKMETRLLEKLIEIKGR